ncbi:hypothetical protein ACH3O9_03955 [Leeuwenhoekiella sp. A16]|uniref:hypothetical protein n=1 Tax=unclassified Leeuwenhoekiella TaxID=2615029 RepID=UPI003A813460
MIKRLLVVVVFILAAPIFAQEGTSSPYSYYGIGSLNFRGTVENQAMGGLSILGDSVHLNLLNPAGYGALKLTNYTLGGEHSEINLKSDEGSASNRSTSLNYLALGFPLSDNLGAGFGLLPYTSVDYKITNESDDAYRYYYGRGGLNKAFLSFGYEPFKGFRVGVTGNYNFGSIRNEAVYDEDGVSYGVREVNNSDLSGFSFNIGLQYEKALESGLTLYSSLNYIPESTLTSENTRNLETVLISRSENAVLSVVDQQSVAVDNNDLVLPSEVTLGFGVGERNKWFAGGEFSSQQSSDFTNRTFEISNAQFNNASKYRIGGYFVPKFNSITSYWDRVTYRAGARFEETGLMINNEDINEFGISFGVGLPIGRAFSNANLSFEYGQRGTTSSGLVKEDFFKFGLSLSLNSKWFVPNKFN